MFENLESTKFEGLGLVSKFASNWLTADGSPAEMNSLAEDSPLLREVLLIIRGDHPTFQYIVNGNIAPPNSRFHSVKSHKPMDSFIWSRSRVQLVNAVDYWGESGVTRKRIRDWCPENGANACLAGFLLKRQGLIPREWGHNTDLRFIFPNTTYEHEDGSLFVASLQKGTVRHPRTDMTRWEIEFLRKNDGINPSDMLVTIV
jgi:hypothetical protein